MTTSASLVSLISRVALVLATGAALVGGASGPQQQRQVASVGTEPTNLGHAKRAVTAYYGGHRGADGHYHHSPGSPWAEDTRTRIQEARVHLEQRLADGVPSPAIVLDIDDTSETTYGWQADNDYGFDRVKQHAAIENSTFEVIEPTLELARWAAEHDVKVYFLTGRRDTVLENSARNLERHGYPVDRDLLHFKPTVNPPAYLTCGVDCPIGEFKALTRAHIQNKLGDTIVLNVGDQDSDFVHGHSDKDVKLPNPLYFTP